MKKVVLSTLLLVSSAMPVMAADAPSGPAPKGTICYSNNLVVAGESNAVIGCKGLGKFASIADIYDRGYRVVSSGFLPETRNGVPPLTSTIYLIIELVDRK